MAVYALASAFPWDKHMDSVMAHHHLVAAYFFTWALQLAYVGYLGLKWKSVRKSDRA